MQSYKKIKQKAVRFILSAILAVGMCACSGTKDTILLGDWVNLIYEKAGLTGEEYDHAYFLNIPEGNQYYEAVQACTGWGVLSENQAFDPQASLDRGWTAATLIRLMAPEMQNPDISIKDINNNIFAKEISTAVAKGLMKTDRRHLFHPDELMDKTEALNLLDQVIDFINHPEVTEERNDIELADDGKFTEFMPLSVDTETNTAVFSSEDILRPGDVFTDGEGNFYQVEQVDTAENVRFHPFDIFDGESSIDIAGNEDLNFDDAEIITSEDTAEHTEETASYYSSVSNFIHGRQKTFQVKGYEIKLVWSGSNISARASRKMPHGTQIYAAAAVRGLHADYRWKSKSSVDHAFFKVSFNGNEALGAKNQKQKDITADFSKINPEHFLSSLKSVFQDQNDCEEKTIQLFKMRIPIAGNPLVDVNLGVNLHITVSGKAEISFTQDCCLGVEVRNGHVRKIHDMDNKLQASMRGDTSLGAEITTSFDLARAALMDIGVEAGIKGSVVTTAHLYDAEGRRNIQNVSVSADFAEEAAEDNPQVLICSDVKAYKMLTLQANSKKCLLGKMGLGQSADILDSGNNTLIPKISGHYENGRIVPACTRRDRIKLPQSDGIKAGKRIELSSYALVVRPGSSKAIQIKTLPDGYGSEDIIFSSADTSIASVSANGTIQPVSSGSTLITISTKDNAYTAGCSVLVPEK